MTIWTATYTYDPDDDVWLAYVVEEQRCHTWGRTLAQAKRHIRDAVTLWVEKPVELVDQVTPPPAAAQAVDDYQRLRAELQILTANLKRAQITAEESLRQAGLSVREAAGVLGISHQRVGQLRKAAPVKATKKVAVKAAVPAKIAAKSAAPGVPAKAAPRRSS